MNRYYRRPRKNIFESTLRSMGRANRLLNENFIFNGEDPYAQMTQSFPMGEGDGMEAMAYQGGEGSGLNPDAQQHVDQIRQVALNGIQPIAYDMYSMRQPMAVDFNFTVGIICVKYELINEFNQMILNKFKSIECYIFPNEHPVTMKLEEISDDSEYDINNRKYYSQAFKITVKAYVVDEADYEVTRLPSRMIMRTDGVNPPKLSVKKFELDTLDTSLSAVTRPEDECLPYEDDMNAKVHDYGDSVSIGEEYVAPEDCIRPDDNHYYYKIITIIVGLDCKDCNTFTLDTDVVIQEIQLENVYDFVVTANKEKMEFSGDTTFYTGDEIGVCITREEEGVPSVVTFVGYDPNVVIDDRDNPESSLDEVPDEEIIEVV